MSPLLSLLRAVLRDELRSLRLGDLAVVTAVAPHADGGDDYNHQCDVRLRDSDAALERVPVATPHVGMVSAPRVGDLVLLSYVGGDANRPVIVGRLYSDEQRPPVHKADEWRVESPPGGKTSIAITDEGAVVVTAGKNVVTVKQDGVISIAGEADFKVEVKGNVALTCADAKIDASGNIELGAGGGGVITEQSHKCYYSGAPLIGSKTVKAKG